MQKRAIRYLRISTKKQSNFSIKGQDDQTRKYCEINDIEIADTFVDKGYSARTFDRPDFIRLKNFIAENRRKKIDYLIVNSMDRFSRDAGEAIVSIKALHKDFGIKITSVSEGVTFDPEDPSSFFYSALMLVKAEDEILRNKNRINLGIYTAKKKEGRHLGKAPIGYAKEKGDGRVPVLIPHPIEADWVRYAFEAYLNGVTTGNIKKELNRRGYKNKGNSAIQKMLQNVVYMGCLRVSAFKDNPAEIVDAIHQPLVSKNTFYRVQELMNTGRKPRVIVREDFPLRGVLHCWCGKPLTGAPSRGKGGSYFNYYKCRNSRHLNLSAAKAHVQMSEIMRLLSLPEEMVEYLRKSIELELEAECKQQDIELKHVQKQLRAAETKMHALEEKFLLNQVNATTYERWHRELSTEIIACKAKIEGYIVNKDEKKYIVMRDIDKLSSLQSFYECASPIEKQQLLNVVFDRSLYYKNGSYRTPYLMPALSLKASVLNDLGLLIIDRKKGISEEIPSGADGGNEIEQMYSLLQLISPKKTA